MSSVSSISSYNVAANYANTSGVQRRQRPDAEKMAEQLFSKLDTSGKGYIQESDLESALSGLTSSSSTSFSQETSSASEIFSQLDSDGDGKVTQDEMTSSLTKLAQSLDTQFDQSRMQGAMPPPPPSDSDAGFTKDELSSQLSEIGSTDSARSSLISKVVENFDKADTNQDGKVSFTEAMAYDQSSTATSSSSTSSSSSSSSDSQSGTQSTDAKIFRQIMELMRSYGTSNTDSGVFGALVSSISTSA